MSVVVGPGKRSKYHVSLSDGSKTIGLIACDSKGVANDKAFTRAPVTRTAMKTTTGNQKYSDFEPPWTPIAQDDFSGGRGNNEFEKETTRYYDSYRANTLYPKIMHGPQETYCTGLRSANMSFPGNVAWWSIITGSGLCFANKFIPSGNYTAANIWILVRRKGTPPADLSVKLLDNDGGVPGSVLQTLTLTTTELTDTLSQWWVFNISGGEAVTAATNYWIQVCSTSGTDENHWEVACSSTHVYGKMSADGTTWVNSTQDLYYRITDADTNNFVRFFQYKRAMYLVRSVASAPSTLWINGDRGAADSNSGALTTLVDATKTWTPDEWAGCYVIITGGVGSNDTQTWRKILSNTATTLTVDSAFDTTHTTATEYVIVGSDKWTEITGHGLTARVTDVLVVNNIIYFAQGDAVAIRRAQFTDSGGTWTPAYADDSTNKAAFLQTVRDKTTGLIEIWKANNLDATSKVSVDVAAIAAWGADLSFSGAPITFEDNHGKITGLEEYGDTDKYLWVFREGSIYAINDGKADEIPLREIRAMANDTNGQAHTIHNAYMYINLGAWLEQYYNRTLTDVGANKDEGLPANRRGSVSALQGHPGRVFMAIDGKSNYSQVLGWNTKGWCEMYRAPKGMRIGCLDYQVIPDVGFNRMWVQQGNDVVWLPFPSDTFDPSQENGYPFTHEAVVESAWIYAGLPDVYKLFNTLKLQTENLDEDVTWIEPDYMLDEDTTWTPLTDAFTISPMEEHDLNSESSVTGKRFKWRIRSYTADNTITPVIKSVVVDTISRVPIKYSYSMTYRLKEGDVDLEGEPDFQGDPLDVQTQLDSWAADLTRLTLHHEKEIFDNKRVFIDPAPLNIIGDREEDYSGKLTMIEV